MDRLRLDKWLWAARIYKTRSLACDEVDKGRVLVNGVAVKPARELKVGDMLQLRQGVVSRTVNVLAISDRRGPAPVAQLLYEETAESLAQRQKQAEMNRLSREPALSIEQGRPTKRDRRQMEKTWDDRWSAGID